MSAAMGADLLREAAAHIRREAEDWMPQDVLVEHRALADLLDAAAEAFPIDFEEPPRNPRDRQMIYAALAVAHAHLGKAADEH